MKQGVLIMSGVRYTEEFKRDAVAQVRTGTCGNAPNFRGPYKQNR